MSSQAKQGINQIVKHALAPHWKAAELTKEQYANINRDISRKLYEIAAEQSVHDESRNRLGRIAKREVANAMKLLTA
jgi:argininosuccinate lyase